MGKLHVLVDSTAHISPDMQLRNANLHVVPLTVTLGEKTWSEPELSIGELFQQVEATARFPLTSQPSPGDFLTYLEPLAAQGCESIIITIAGGLSGTVRSASAAAGMVKAHPVLVVDSGTTAIGMEKMAETALKLSDQGMKTEAIATHLKRMAETTHTLFVPATLDYLYKGGRIGGAAALLGNLLQIRPILYLAEGKVSVLDKVRTHRRALARMVEELNRYERFDYIGVVHLGAEDEALQLADTLKQRDPTVPVSVTTGGAVLGSHLGPGLVGIVFQTAWD